MKAQFLAGIVFEFGKLMGLKRKFLSISKSLLRQA
jgi:hypothetical protein